MEDFVEAYRIHGIKSLMTLAACVVATAGLAAASSLSGSQVTITSSFTSGTTGPTPTQNQTVTVGTNESPDGSIELSGSSANAFSWMSDGDYIDIFENPADSSRKVIKIFFDKSDSFQSNDDIKLSFELDSAYTILTPSLGDFISVWAADPGLVVDGTTMTVDLIMLDQIGNVGESDNKAEIRFFLDGPDGEGDAVATPEPGTIGLALAGGAALFLRRRRS
jgi:hypothetical protein